MRVLSDWRSVRLWETQVERDLHRNHSLRTHGLMIGTFMLLLMWAASYAQMRLGVHSLAVRYFFTLGASYVGYLLVLRWWAARLVTQDTRLNPELPDLTAGGCPSTPLGLDAGGGDHGAGSIARGALDLAAGADEGAVVAVPVVAIFLIGVAIVFGAGALVLLYFGWDALLAVAIELAFSYVSARAAVRVARAGWLAAAVRLTWKPLLGALFCAVLLGMALDHFMPQVDSLPQALRVMLKR